MGAGIARLVVEKPGLVLVGAYGRRKERADADLGLAIGLERKLGVGIDADLAACIERSRPEVAIQATCSKLEQAWPEISILLDQGISVISIAEEMAFPAYRSPEIADELHQKAMARGVAVVGTGINPGFVLDLLVIALSSVCSEVRSITATRANDLSPYGPTVLATQGVGLTPSAFERGLAEGTVTGHFGFPESMHMIAAAVGWDLDRVEEERAPIIARAPRETPFVTVQPGQVAGCLHTATAYRNNEPVIKLLHPQQVRPEVEAIETGDTIEIAGTPSLKLAGSPEIPGGLGTVAIAVNMIPRVLNAAPGLHTMADLPVPAAMLGDARRFVDYLSVEGHRA